MCTALRFTASIAFLLFIFRGAVRLLPTLLIVLLLTTAALLLATLASLLVLLISLIGHFWLLAIQDNASLLPHVPVPQYPVPCPPLPAA
jgi:hypothetical protein